jgi:EAL domain-containing protein (putative c-di-GMP-specific phosphodiesterase class I)
MVIANPEKATISSRSFELSVTSGYDRYSVEHGEWTLSSVFQPVFSLSHMRAVGYEGLLRAHDMLDRVVSPLDVFGQAARVGEALQVDRLSQALHLENFKMLGAQTEWLFLNVHPGALTEPYHAAALLANLKRLKIEPRRVVLEVLEQRAEDIERLAEAVQQFREHGFLIALDDFGAGHSNIERIWQLDPDLVKLDRVMLSHAGHNVHAATARSSKQRRNMEAVLSGIVSLLHEAGKLVLIEGVETEHEAQLALASGADFVQGFFFARPHPGLADSVHAQTVISELTERYRMQTEARERRVATRLQPYVRAFGPPSGLRPANRWRRCAGISSRSTTRRAVSCSTRTDGRRAATSCCARIGRRTKRASCRSSTRRARTGCAGRISARRSATPSACT